MGLVRCLSLVLPVVLGSQQYGSPVGTVAGIVTEAGSALPISQVAVTIDGTSLGTLTNQDGEFLILGVPEGAHQVSFARAWYHEVAVRMEFDEAGEARIDLGLPLSQDEFEKGLCR